MLTIEQVAKKLNGSNRWEEGNDELFAEAGEAEKKGGK